MRTLHDAAHEESLACASSASIAAPLRRGAWIACVISLCVSSDVYAQPEPAPEVAHEEDEYASEIEDGGEVVTYEEYAPAPEEGGEVETRARPRRLPDPGQASSTVTREEMDERQPRSAPDALRYEEGVFVQQTAHSQGSAFVRGRTGQQTVLMFDDVRLNNSLFRQGPNQYFFTIDSGTIDHIDVVRGSASTRYGSDAIAGAINAVPINPTFDTSEGFFIRPQVQYRYSSADGESGGRLSLDTQFGPRFAILAGFGGRTVGQLEGGGILESPISGEPPEVPRFAEDDRTQLGTGFDELTGDARAVYYLDDDKLATFAYYAYRQYDAPRTDQCPPAEAPFDDCLSYDEQFRTLVYGTLEGNWGPHARQSRLVVSMQNQHEFRTNDRPTSQVINRGQDDVTTWGVLYRATTESWLLSEDVRLLGRYGGDLYRDRVESHAESELLNLDKVTTASRGLYVTGSQYGWGGLWSEVEAQLYDRVIARAGGRLAHVDVYAPEDAASETQGVDRAWNPLVGNVGAEWWATEWLTLLANADQGFRAPNLDDLTSRQRTGPGFQIENPNLEPERGVTTEVGVQVATLKVEADAWVYRSTLRDAITRTTRDVDACPPQVSGCTTERTRLQLVNLPGTSQIWGAEGSVKLTLEHGVELRSTIAWAWGDGPRPLVQADTQTAQREDRVPLSRIPPLNGTAEGIWRGPRGIYIGSGFRWARPQDRLALSDISDRRIPRGGTPGFAVLDARAGWRFGPRAAVHTVLENLTDEAYRYHGSSVNGPGRSVTLQMELGL